MNPQWWSVGIMIGLAVVNGWYIVENWRNKPMRDAIARQDREIDRLHEKASEMANKIQAVIGTVEVHLAEARLLERRRSGR